MPRKPTNARFRDDLDSGLPAGEGAVTRLCPHLSRDPYSPFPSSQDRVMIGGFPGFSRTRGGRGANPRREACWRLDVQISGGFPPDPDLARISSAHPSRPSAPWRRWETRSSAISSIPSDPTEFRRSITTTCGTTAGPLCVSFTKNRAPCPSHPRPVKSSWKGPNPLRKSIPSCGSAPIDTPVRVALVPCLDAVS